MSPIRVVENTRLAAQLNQLDQLKQFISGLATAIAAGRHDFESVWSIANRVYDRHSSTPTDFLASSGLPQSGNALGV
jgi:hypothetical protein